MFNDNANNQNSTFSGFLSQNQRQCQLVLEFESFKIMKKMHKLFLDGD